MPNNNPNGPSEERDPRQQHPSMQFSRPLGMLHKFYLTGEIGDPGNYIDWFETIRSAGENDMVMIHINSMGGRSDTAIQFMRVMMETQAMVVASVEGMCMSAATFIFLAAKQHQITDHSVFLFHNYSGGALGKGGELYTQMIHQRKWSDTLVRSVYKDFLSESEINELLDDKDFWLTPEEVVQRLLNRHKKMEEAGRQEILNRLPVPTPAPITPVVSPEQNLLKAIADSQAKADKKAAKKKTVKRKVRAKKTEPQLLTE